VAKHTGKALPAPAPAGKLYRVQVGAYSIRANAEVQLAKAKKAGFTDAFIVED
jgi:N-acetylmuramoyl-L-alanine amidase